MLRIYIKHLIKGNGNVDDDDDNADDLRRKDRTTFRVTQSQGLVQVLLLCPDYLCRPESSFEKWLFSHR